jgi:CheY-like chemotaxis protein
MEEQLIGAEAPSEVKSGPARLAAATSNGHLIRFLQNLAHAEGWALRVHLSGAEAVEAAAAEPTSLLVVDVFLDDQSGFELRSQMRRHPVTQMVPILLVAPGCGSAEELSNRLEISSARFQAAAVDDVGLSEVIRRLVGRSEALEAVRARFRYATFLQAAGEAYHAANQPLTSLLCNLELLLRQEMNEATRARVKTSHDSAVQIMATIRQLQRAKWSEEKTYFVPVYLLPRRTESSGASAF